MGVRQVWELMKLWGKNRDEVDSILKEAKDVLDKWKAAKADDKVTPKELIEINIQVMELLKSLVPLLENLSEHGDDDVVVQESA